MGSIARRLTRVLGPNMKKELSDHRIFMSTRFSKSLLRIHTFRMSGSLWSIFPRSWPIMTPWFCSLRDTELISSTSINQRMRTYTYDSAIKTAVLRAQRDRDFRTFYFSRVIVGWLPLGARSERKERWSCSNVCIDPPLPDRSMVEPSPFVNKRAESIMLLSTTVILDTLFRLSYCWRNSSFELTATYRKWEMHSTRRASSTLVPYKWRL